jgi:hypothetical protein
MPTGGITTSGATTLKTPSDTLVITTHLLNQIGDISWDIKNGSGTDFSTQFNISDNLDGSYNFNLKAPWVSASVDVFFMCKNNDLDSNTITITLSQ